jgi:hypothetical protein
LLALGLALGTAFAQTDTDQQQQSSTSSVSAPKGKSADSNKSTKEQIGEWLKTCLQDWDAATHMNRKEWRTTCERVSAERGKFLRENPSYAPLLDTGKPQR